MVGIASYGVYIPAGRISVAAIAEKWGKDPEIIRKSLGILEKSRPAIDEDSVTLAVAAAQKAFNKTQLKPSETEAIFVGSESHPYAVNPTSTIVGEVLGCGHDYLAVDLQFACKAATSGMQIAAGLLSAGRAKQVLVIGSDCAQGKEHDVLEYTAGAGAGAFILTNQSKVTAEIVDYLSFSSDTPDFWRRDGMKHPSHGGRFTAEPGYLYHVVSAGQKLLTKSGLKPADFRYAVFHMPNGKLPLLAARQLGFSHEQIAPSLIVTKIGNPYTASSLIGLAAVLDRAQKNDKIFLVSYGSGAGSDAFIIIKK